MITAQIWVIAGVEWARVKEWPEGLSAGPLVQTKVAVSRRGAVKLSVRPSKLVVSMSSPEQRKAARATRDVVRQGHVYVSSPNCHT